MQRIGIDNRSNISQVLDSHAIYPFTHVGPAPWTAQDVANCNAWARQDMNDVNLKLYVM